MPGSHLVKVKRRSNAGLNKGRIPNLGIERLEVVKEVVGDFARRRMTDRVGAADNVALFTFARYPDLVCPFTLDAGALTGFLADVELVSYGPQDGTAISDAPRCPPSAARQPRSSGPTRCPTAS